MKILKGIFCIAVLCVLVLDVHDRVQAQTPVAATLQGSAAHTTCITPVAGQYFLCLATDGIWVSNNGAAYFQLLAAGATAGVQKVNGVAPGATGNVTVSCAGTTPATSAPVSAPPLTITGGDLAIGGATASVPSMTVTTNCAATGS